MHVIDLGAQNIDELPESREPRLQVGSIHTPITIAYQLLMMSILSYLWTILTKEQPPALTRLNCKNDRELTEFRTVALL